MDGTFAITEAWEVTAARVQEASLSAHVAARQPTLSQVREWGTNVAAEMQAAYARIDD